MHGTGPRKEGKRGKSGGGEGFVTLRAMGNLEGEGKLSIFGSALTTRADVVAHLTHWRCFERPRKKKKL